MTLKYRISGIYDARTLSKLKELDIYHYSFDFIPTSFNFLQLHLVEQILENNLSGVENLYFKFKGEKEFVIEKILKDVSSNVGNAKSFSLEFCDEFDVSFYESFKKNFVWHFSPNVNYEIVAESEFCTGLILNQASLERLYKEGKLNSLARFLMSIKIKKPSFKVFLDLDWDFDLAPSFYEVIEFDVISFSINHHIEVCYRNVDLLKLEQYLLSYKKNIFQF